jgi:hypothetical protein
MGSDELGDIFLWNWSDTSTGVRDTKERRQMGSLYLDNIDYSSIFLAAAVAATATATTQNL